MSCQRAACFAGGLRCGNGYGAWMNDEMIIIKKKEGRKQIFAMGESLSVDGMATTAANAGDFRRLMSSHQERVSLVRCAHTTCQTNKNSGTCAICKAISHSPSNRLLFSHIIAHSLAWIGNELHIYVYYYYLPSILWVNSARHTQETEKTLNCYCRCWWIIACKRMW